MAGEVFVYGPANVNDSAAIVTLLSGQAVVADDITAHTANNQVWYTVVKA